MAHDFVDFHDSRVTTIVMLPEGICEVHLRQVTLLSNETNDEDAPRSATVVMRVGGVSKVEMDYTYARELVMEVDVLDETTSVDGAGLLTGRRRAQTISLGWFGMRRGLVIHCEWVELEISAIDQETPD